MMVCTRILDAQAWKNVYVTHNFPAGFAKFESNIVGFIKSKGDSQIAYLNRRGAHSVKKYLVACKPYPYTPHTHLMDG